MKKKLGEAKVELNALLPRGPNGKSPPISATQRMDNLRVARKKMEAKEELKKRKEEREKEEKAKEYKSLVQLAYALGFNDGAWLGHWENYKGGSSQEEHDLTYQRGYVLKLEQRIYSRD